MPMRTAENNPLKPHKSTEGAKNTKMKDDIVQLCDQVRESSFALHRYLRHGHLEKVYENGLYHRLRKQGLEAVQQHPLTVLDVDGTLLGEFLSRSLPPPSADR